MLWLLPPGRSAIAVIRISGAYALQVPGLFGQPPLAGRGMRYARLQRSPRRTAG